MRIEDKLSAIVKGFVKISIDDKDVKGDMIDFELKPVEGDKADIFFNYKKTQEASQRYEEVVKKGNCTDEFIDKHDLRSKMLMDAQNDIMKKILTRSYPAFNKEHIESIIMSYGNEILIELYMFWGLINKDAYEALKKKQQEEIKKLGGEEQTQEKKLQNKSERKSTDE